MRTYVWGGLQIGLFLASAIISTAYAWMFHWALGSGVTALWFGLALGVARYALDAKRATR